jgi:hypothetical protein
LQVIADMQLGSRLADSEAAEIVSFLHSLTAKMPVNYSPPETPPAQAARSEREGNMEAFMALPRSARSGRRGIVRAA